MALLAAGVAIHATPAFAQLRLPNVGVPAPVVPREVTAPLGAATAQAGVDLTTLRRLKIAELLRSQRRTLDADRHGDPIVRGEILVLGPGLGALERALTAGLTVLRRESLAGLDAEIVVLSVPPTASIHRTLDRLRAADPDGTYDYNHLYVGVGVDGPPAASEPAAPLAAIAGAAIRIGLIDSGVDSRHPAFATARVQAWGCGGAPHPDGHGTAVGSLIAGSDLGFHGAAPGATLYAADVYCGRSDGGATDAIAGALGWLAGERVPVVNVSLVGPRNDMLAGIVARVVARGILIVAAVGNDGPAAPALYPAAYPGVVGVTGVDARRRVLVEAIRGPQVMFAAPAAEVSAAAAGGGYREVRGTSFAAPIVAALLGARCAAAPCLAALRVLALEAVDLGSPGRDPVYGFGLVGDDIRNPPKK